MIGIQLEPADALFFRDGTPFTAQSAPQEGVGSLFPPHPPTTAGALRAALALCNGWNGRGRWPERLDEILGDGPNDLGALAVDGPFLLRNCEPLFPAPLHLLGSNEAGQWTPRLLLRPGPAVACDLGDAVRLPETPQTSEEVERLKTGEGFRLTRSGMEAVLRGALPAEDEVVSRRKLWSEEARIGLQRDGDARTAVEGMLYSTRHVRLQRGVSLGLRVAGVPDGWTRPFGRMVPLGGESRLAECREWNGEVTFDIPLKTTVNGGRATVIALSPLDIERDVYCGRQPLADFGGAQVVSACLDRPQRIGGWDSLARAPLPLRCLLPPGSVLFCEIPEPERHRVVAAADTGLIRLGARQEWGFGLAALGPWPSERETTE